jgi:hypothetical protein
LVVYVDTFYKYAVMDNDECTDEQLKFQNSHNPSIFITTPIVGSADIYIAAAYYAVITEKFWRLNQQQQAFAQIVRLRLSRVPHPW